MTDENALPESTPDAAVEEPVEAQSEAQSEAPVEEQNEARPSSEKTAWRAALPDLSPANKQLAEGHLGVLMDVGVEVSAVVGRRQLTLEQLLAVGPGTIIDLEKDGGEPIELMVNGKPFALAEIVVIEGRLGARIVETLGDPRLVQEPAAASEQA